ncbi:unnamed protein product [Effrenium voratum]|nr:unnamed protein product [Effrenium voratum]
MEIYSSPRIAPFCQRLLLQCGPSIDLKTGFDLTKQYFQQQVLSQLATLQPLVIMLSPPCTVFSQVQNTLQHRRKDLDLWKARFAEGLALFMFALMVFKAQVVAGRYAVLEHPWLASSWALPAVQNLLNTVANIRVLVFDQCLLGLRTTVRQLPVRKRTKLLTNWPGISPCFNVRCSAETCNHVPMSHAWLQGAEGGVSRCRSAQEYPDTFCANFASSVKAQVLANVALDYDRAVFRAYQLKMQSHESAVHHAKIEWKQKLQQEAAHWSTSWLAKKCKIFSYDASQTGALQKLANDNMQALIRSAGLERSSVAVLSILNWSAPATQAQLAQEAQASCFAQLVAENPINLGVLFCPVFHYKKHQMHVLEHVLLKSLACRGVDVDFQATLMYRDRKDIRDNRPLSYPLRIIRPYIDNLHISEDEGDDAQEQRTTRSRRNPAGRYWQSCQLMRTRRTDEAEQVPNAKLEAALPATTDIDGSLRGGRRFEQIGVSAASKLLEALLETEMPNNMSGIMICDLCTGVGDVFWAWLERLKAMKCPILYMGASADPVSVEWLNHVIVDELTKKLLSQNVVLPGFHTRPADVPAEVLSQPPPLPQLNVCTVQGGTIVVPQSVNDQWVSHGSYGAEFQQIVLGIVSEFGEPSSEQQAAPTASPEPSPKKQRVAGPIKTELVEQLPPVRLAQAAVTGLKKDMAGKVMVRVATDHTWMLLNMSTSKIALQGGTVIAGFGAGTFKHVPRQAEGKLGAADADKHVLFSLKDSNCLVIHNNKLVQLGDVINAAQGTRASADVCYHTVKPQAGTDLKHFELERKHEVYYLPSPKASAKADPSNEDPANIEVKGSSALAALVPLSSLQFQHCAVVWAVKWATKGLTPIKPVVALVCDVEMASQHAVRL